MIDEFEYRNDFTFGVGRDKKLAKEEINSVRQHKEAIIIYHKNYMIYIDPERKQYSIIDYGG